MASDVAALGALRGGVGLWTTSLEALSAREGADVVADVERLGYTGLWFPEAWGREALTSAALLLSATTTLTVATGIASIWGRDAVAAAAATKTLNAAYDDRFLLGLGVSHRPLVERLRGHEYATPVAAMRAYLTAMDAAPMFAPEGGRSYGRVVAALGPRMLALGAELADGVHTYLVTPEHTAGARDIVGPSFLAVEQAVVLDESREEFLRRAHAHLEIYTGLDNYRASWRRAGFDESDFVRGGSERLCDAMVVHGDEAKIAARVDEHRAAGADHVCLQVLGADTGAPIDEWRRLAPAVLAQ